MNGVPASAGLLRRALALVLLTAGSGAGLVALARSSGVTAWIGRWDISPSLDVKLALAAGITLFIGSACAAWLFGAADRFVGAALGTLAGPDDGGGDGQEVNLARLSTAVLEWRHRAYSAEAARDRLEQAAAQLARTLEATWVDAAGEQDASMPPGPAPSPADYDDEGLRALAAAAQGAIEGAGRLRSVLDALLERVANDLLEVGEPLSMLTETVTGMGRVLEDLVATYPGIRPLAALQTALDDCSAEVARARQSVELVERELGAVRRRMGGARVDRLTVRDLLSREPRDSTREGRT